MDNMKKMAAAISAVMNYIKTEEEILCMQAMASMPGARPVSSVPPAPLKLWGISGRLAQMQMRNMMQIKAFHGLKLK